jgi:carbonic anhydrase
MLKSYQRLLDGNKNWVETTLAKDPDFFKNLNTGQNPEFLWIGCSDSRVPANEITGTKSGDIFVHRNIANLVVHTDVNIMSVLKYAVEVLKVKHIIVCGHYNCGGVNAALTSKHYGLVNMWLRNIKQVYDKYSSVLDSIEDPQLRANKLVEYNVIESVHNLAKTQIVQEAWKNQTLQIHGWVYGLENGLIKDLQVMIHQLDDLEPIFRFE